MRQRTTAAAALLVVATLVACDDAGVVAPPEPDTSVDARAHQHDQPATMAHDALHSAAQNRINALIRRSTARYQQVDRAIEDGYERSGECVATPFGGMGYHYVRMSLIDGTVDPASPHVLVYEPQKNGRLRLGAVEFIVPAALWAGSDPPTLGAVPFDDHTPPGSPGPPFPHYQLHAWIWTHNPAGMYAPFNPNVSCDWAADD